MKKCILVALILFISNTAHAGIFHYFTFESPFTPNVSNQGWWSNDGLGNVTGGGDTNDNYLASGVGGGIISSFNNYFTFDLSSLNEKVISARFDVTLFGVEAVNSITYSLFDVSTDAQTLNNNVFPFQLGFDPFFIWEDLGTGNKYGEYIFNVPPETPNGFLNDEFPNEVISIDLNSFALADINSSRGGYFSLGGSITNGYYYLFGASGNSLGLQRLVVETEANVVPEPSTLLIFGAFSFGACVRRRKSSL